LRRGISKTTRIAVWNNVGGHAKDRDEYLTQHMVDLMRETGGKIEAINTTKHLFESGPHAPKEAKVSPAKKAGKSSKK
jgi:ribosomal protein L7/L12